MSAHAHKEKFNMPLLLLGGVGIGALLWYLSQNPDALKEYSGGGGGGGSVITPAQNVITPTPDYAYTTTYNFPAPNMGGGIDDISGLLASLLASLGIEAPVTQAPIATAKKDTTVVTGGAGAPYPDVRKYLTTSGGIQFDVQGKEITSKKDEMGIPYLSVTDLARGMTEMRIYDTGEGLAALEAFSKKSQDTVSPYAGGLALPTTQIISPSFNPFSYTWGDPSTPLPLSTKAGTGEYLGQYAIPYAALGNVLFFETGKEYLEGSWANTPSGASVTAAAAAGYKVIGTSIALSPSEQAMTSKKIAAREIAVQGYTYISPVAISEMSKKEAAIAGAGIGGGFRSIAAGGTSTSFVGGYSGMGGGFFGGTGSW